MRHSLLIIIPIFAMVFSTAAQDSGRGLTTVRVYHPEGDVSEEQFYSGSYALLVANSDYRYWPDLPAVPGEMAKVKEALIAHGFQIFQNRVLENLDGDELREAYHQFIDAHGFDPNNRLVLFFSGHGHSRGEPGYEKGYIVPVDAPTPAQNDIELARVAVEMEQVSAWMKRIESRHALFLFDSCFSGSVLSSSKSFPQPPSRIMRQAKDKVRMFITAGAANEEVPGKSTFTPAFVDALSSRKADLNQDGYVLGLELANYLRDEVAKYTYPSNTVQFGTIRDRVLAQGDMVFQVSQTMIPQIRRPENGATTSDPVIPVMTPPNGEDQLFTSLQPSNYRSAASKADEILRSDPQNSPALYVMGYAAWQEGRKDDALNVLELAVKADRNNHQAYALRGRINLEANKLSQAESDFSQAVLGNSGVADYHYYLGRCKPVYDAIGHYTKAIELDDSLPDAYLWRARACIEMGDGTSWTQKAMDDYESYLEINSKDADVWFEFAEFLERKSAGPKAMQARRTALELQN